MALFRREIKQEPVIKPATQLLSEREFAGVKYKEVFSVMVSPPQLEKLLKTALNLPGVPARLGKIEAFGGYSATTMDTLAVDIAHNQRQELVNALPAEVIGLVAYTHNPSGVTLNDALFNDVLRGALTFGQDKWMNLAMFQQMKTN